MRQPVTCICLEHQTIALIIKGQMSDQKSPSGHTVVTGRAPGAWGPIADAAQAPKEGLEMTM